MKQPKKLTRNQKEMLKKANMTPEMWMLQSEDPEKYVFVNKINGQTRIKMKIR